MVIVDKEAIGLSRGHNDSASSHHHHWAAVESCGWAKASACRLQITLSSARSCRSSICPGRLSTAWLVSLVVFSCHVVSKW